MAHLDDQEQGASDDDEDEHHSVENNHDPSERTTLLPKHDAKGVGTWHFVRSILIETAPTLLLTITGLTFTGELLEKVTQWQALKEVDELYILIPMLNNLKGNLEMNLSSRLSTSAILGHLDVPSVRNPMIYGAMSLLQIQALIVSAIAAVLSFFLGRVMTPVSGTRKDAQSGSIMGMPPFRRPPSTRKSPSGLQEFIVVLCTAMASASLSGLVLGSFMCSLIVICRHFRRNPDNIAPPMASCLGDLLTLCILGFVSSILIQSIGTAIPVVLVVLLIFGAVVAVILTLRNEYVRRLIGSGWITLFGAMFVSSASGLVLEHFIARYEGFGLLAIAISGLPDAVGCVCVSRISTSLHASVSHSYLQDGRSTSDLRTFVTIMTLFVVTLPVQLLYVTFLHATGWMKLPGLFVVLFVISFCCAVLTSLVMANILTHFLWRRNLDPDTYAMPIQSSVVDLTGQLLLVVCYELAQALGAKVKKKHSQ